MDKTLAAIDIGSNSTNLLIVDQAGQTLQRIVRSTRLGANIGATGALSAESMQRTLECLREYESLIKQHNVSHRRTVATAACRAAKNTGEFFAKVEKISGAAPELITGEIEGALSFVGATSSFDDRISTLVVDIGGASTELMVGTDTLDFAVSLPFGAVNLTESELHRDPPRPEELTNAISLVSDGVDDVAHNYPLIGEVERVVGVAGTIVTVAAVEVGQKTFDPAALHKLTLSRDAVEDVFRTLATEPLRDRVFNPGLPRDRADIIVGGCCVLVAVMRRLQISEIVVSQYNLLDGLISELRKKIS
ncbi:MAG: Ppx/GppA phosphatase family protein [Actinomycetota bacterium]|nr:Ppx/GppA phosphatase family protein [Actinomycetota bacterium]